MTFEATSLARCDIAVGHTMRCGSLGAMPGACCRDVHLERRMLSERARRGPRPRLGHRVLASFLRTVAEACSPQRLREESAREIYLTLLSLATCVRESVSNYVIVSSAAASVT